MFREERGSLRAVILLYELPFSRVPISHCTEESLRTIFLQPFVQRAQLSESVIADNDSLAFSGRLDDQPVRAHTRWSNFYLPRPDQFFQQDKVFLFYLVAKCGINENSNSRARIRSVCQDLIPSFHEDWE